MQTCSRAVTGRIRIRMMWALALAVLCAPQGLAQGVLSVEIVTGYNLIVDSNVTAPSTYAPSAAYIGAQVCNTGNASLDNVTAYTGNYAASTKSITATIAADGRTLTRTAGSFFDATTDGGLRVTGTGIPGGTWLSAVSSTTVATLSAASTPGAGIAIQLSSAPGVFPVTTFGADPNPLRFHLANTGPYSMTLEVGSGTIEDGTRYIGTLAAGECRIQYWLFSYPQCVNVNGAQQYPPCDVSIAGGVKAEDDLTLDYDVWATTTTGIAAPTVAETRDFTMRNEISASANKIWPNTASKVPDEYLAAIQGVVGWGTLGPDGQPLTTASAVYPGQRVITTQGIWYDLGNVGHGFDNNGDLIPDQNAWLQPVGDPSGFDTACFRMVNVYGIVIVKLKSGGELLIPFQNQLYHENLPDNTGVVGLVYYQYIATREGCSANMTPYQEAASGYDNEKFAGDYGLNLGLASGAFDTDLAFSKTDGVSTIAAGGTLTYTVTATNSTGVPLGAPDLGTPLLFRESIPSGTTYVASSADNAMVAPTGTGTYTQGYTDVDGNLDPCTLNYNITSSSWLPFYSNDGGFTWVLTEPAGVTDIRWLLQATIALDGSHDRSACVAPNGVYDDGTLQTSLPPGKTVTVQFQVTVNSNSGAVICNTARVGFGPALSNVDATDCTLVSGPNSIGGTVFEDDGGTGGTYGNGLIDNATEVGIGNGTTGTLVRLYYDANADGEVDEDDLYYGQTFASSTGTYSFTGLPDGNFVVSVKKYDGVTVTTISGDTTVTSAQAVFTSADVGKTISGTGIPGGATISAVNSPTEIEISSVATASGTVIAMVAASTTDAATEFAAGRVANANATTGWGNTTFDPNQALTTDSGILKLHEDLPTVSLAISIDLDHSNGANQSLTTTSLTAINFGFAPPFELTKTVAATTVDEGDHFDYTIVLTNRLPSVGVQGPTGCQYTAWATTGSNGSPAGKAFTNFGDAHDGPNRQEASAYITGGANRFMYSEGFRLADQAGSISRVEVLLMAYYDVPLTNDKLELQARLAGVDNTLTELGAAALDSYIGAPADLNPNSAISWDVTNNRPGGGSWSFADDFFALRVYTNPAKASGADTRTFYMDAVGIRVTTDADCVAGASTTLAPVPLQDRYDATWMSFVSAVPPPTTVSGSTLQWDDVGPILPGTSNVVTVTMRANDVSGLVTGTCGVGPSAISTLSSSGTLATATTTAPHTLASGQTVTIAGATSNPTLYNGTFTVTVTGASTFTYTMTGTPGTSPALGTKTFLAPGTGLAAITGISRSGTLATVTTTAPHTLITGQSVTISGATSDPTLYNGTFTVTVTGASTFTYTMTGTPSASATGTLSLSAAPPANSNCNLAETAYAGHNVYYADGRLANDDDDKVAVNIQGKGELRGTVFRDDGNTAADGWSMEAANIDFRMANVSVTLFSCMYNGAPVTNSTNKACTDNSLGPGAWQAIATTVTGTDGSYEFLGLDTGFYIIQVGDTDGVVTTAGSSPFGFTQTAEARDAQTVTGTGPFTSNGDDCLPISGGVTCNNTWGTSTANTQDLNRIEASTEETIEGINFGYYSTLALIFGNVWHDADGDATRDTSDGDLDNFTVQLWTDPSNDGFTDPDGDGVPTDGSLVATDVSDANGDYAFAVTPGGSTTYSIVVTPELLPNNVWAQTAEFKTVPVTTTSGSSTVTASGLFAATDVGRVITGTGIPVGATITTFTNSTTVVISANATATGSVTATVRDASVTLNNWISITVSGGVTSGSHDFGYTLDTTSNIGDTVYIDFDADGIQDPTENGIPDVTVWLYEDVDRDGVIDAGVDDLLQTDVTDASGNYLFTGLPEGNYVVKVDTSDSDFPSDVTATADPDIFAGTIGNYVWYDADNDGVQDATEAGIPGITVLLWAADENAGFNSSQDTLIAAATTNINGNYLFTALPAGSYYVTVDEDTLPTTLSRQTPVAANSSLITLASSTASDSSADFGYYSTTAAIGSRVWHDTDGDGIQDAGEVGLPGIGISVTGTGCAPCTATTDEAGYWIVNGLSNAAYTITVTSADLPTSFVATTGTTGTDSVTVAGLVDNVNLTTGVTATDFDFGYRYTTPASSPTGSITGSVFLDADGDDVLDSGEAMTSVTVNLLDENGYVIATTTTNGSGAYTFTGVFIGDYAVEVLASYGTRYSVLFLSSTAGFPNLNVAYDATQATTPDDQSSVAVDGVHDNLLQDFGYERFLGSIGDTVYWDANENGTQDLGEPGFPNVTLSLYDCTWADDGDFIFESGERTCGAAVETDVTTADDPLTAADESGKYLFSNLDTLATNHYYVVGVSTGTLPGTYSATPGTGTYLTADPETDGLVCSALTLVTDPPSTACDNFNLVQVFRGGLNYLGADFGYQIAALTNYGKLGDHVWIDSDGDGTVDSGEPGIPNITVWIDVDNDSVLDGPRTLDVTTASSSTTVTSSALFTSADVGKTISGPGIPSGATITAFTNASTVTISAAATAAGSVVASLGARTFTVGTTSGGTTVTSATRFAATDVGKLISGTGIPAGAYISGFTNTSSVTISVAATATGSVTGAVAERTAVTDTDGYYLFTGLPDTTYRVRVFTTDGDWPSGLSTTPTFEVRSSNSGSLNNLAIGTMSGGSITNIDDGTTSAACSGCDLSFDFGYRYTGTNSLSGTICVDDPAEDGNCGRETATVSTTISSTTVTSVGLFSSDMVGSSISGTGIPAGATITGFTDANTITISAAATATGSATATINRYSSVVPGDESPLGGISVYLYRWTDDSDNSGWAVDGTLDAGDTFVLLGSTSTDANGDYSFTNVPDNVVVVFGVSPAATLLLTTTQANTAIEDTGLSRQVYDGQVIYDSTLVSSTVRQALQLGPDADNIIRNVDYAFDATYNGTITYDYGDLPNDTYAGTVPDYNMTLQRVGGARHLVGSVFLGSGVTSDTDGFDSSNATGETDSALDGVALVGGQISPGTDGGALDVFVTNPTSAQAWLVGWMDFNKDGDFADDGERIVQQAVVAGQQYIFFDVPTARPLTVTTVLNSATVTSAGLFSPEDVGATITGTGIPPGSTIIGYTDANTVTISALATAGGTSEGTISPWEAASETYFSRFRIFATEPLLVSATGTSLSSTFAPLGGEVEDYAFALAVTPAVVTRFAAYDTGGVTLEWDTSAEVGTIGWFVHRYDDAARRFVPVNDKLLPALHKRQGGTYRFADPTAAPDTTYSYQLVEVESSGRRNVYGPYRVNTRQTVAAGASPAYQARQQRLDRAKLREGFAAAARPMTRKPARARGVAPAPPTPPGYAQGVKLETSATGIYYISLADLVAQGGVPLDAGWLHSAHSPYGLHQGGQAVAFDSNSDGILFYGEGLDSIYTANNVYWLGPGAGPAPRVEVRRDMRPASATGAESFQRNVREEQDVFQADAAFTDAEADTWGWDFVYSTFDTKLFPFRTDGARASGPASVRIRLKGLSDTFANPDHRAVVEINGVRVGDVPFNGLDEATGELTFDSSALIDGDNVLALSGDATDAPWSVFYLDSFEVHYPSAYRAVGNQLKASAAGNASVQLTGFTRADIVVFDVTDSRRPVRVEGRIRPASGGGYSVTLTPPTADTVYFAATPDAFLAPARVRPDAPSSLADADNGAAYLILGPADLLSTAQRLATYRSDLSSMVVDIEDVYDEFNHSIPHPDAIRSFLAWAHEHWREAPRYALLAGDGSSDYKDVFGLDEGRVPIKRIGTPNGLVPGDAWYGEWDAGQPGPEVAIGRLPVASAAELDQVIDKIISREASLGSPWMQNFVLVADNEDQGGPFPEDSERVALVSGGVQEKLYLSPAAGVAAVSASYARQHLADAFTNGAGFISYLGHGGYDLLATEGLLRSSDVVAMSNLNQPVLTAMTCVSNDFALPGYPSVGELLVRQPGGGAAAVWGAAALSQNEFATLLAEGFYESVTYGSAARLGDAIRESIARYQTIRGPQYMADGYVLLGDPAMRVR